MLRGFGAAPCPFKTLFTLSGLPSDWLLLANRRFKQQVGSAAVLIARDVKDIYLPKQNRSNFKILYIYKFCLTA